MIGSSGIEKALEAVLSENLDSRLLLLKKNIAAVENENLKSTHRLCRAMRLVISSVKANPAVTPEQRQLCAEYSGRVRNFDPRRNRSRPDEVEPAELDPVKPRPSSPPVPDGFIRGLIDPVAAIARVSFKHGSQQPPWNTDNQVEVLRTALGDVPLDTNAVRQLWLTLAYDFKERLVGSDTAPQTKCILACICAHANRNQIALPTPNCLNLIEELAFRS